MTDWEGGATQLPDVDTSVPSIARVYDYWLGGYFLKHRLAAKP